MPRRVGYTDMSQYERDASLPLGPEQIREHMYEFWRQEIGRPVTVVGASLGGTMALDFAYHYPEVRCRHGHPLHAFFFSLALACNVVADLAASVSAPSVLAYPPERCRTEAHLS